MISQMTKDSVLVDVAVDQGISSLQDLSRNFLLSKFID
jgi:alanine dehydrogenase